MAKKYQGVFKEDTRRIGIKNNYTATDNPTVNDDASAGYSVGSEWIEDGEGIIYYKCLRNEIGNALWVQVATS